MSDKLPSGCLFFLSIFKGKNDSEQEPEQASVSGKLSYIKKTLLLSPAEQLFYKHLLQAVGNKLTVFCKIRVSDVLEADKGSQNYRGLMNKINQKHIDFVLCHPASSQILVAIELDDKSHQKKSRIERDIFLNEAFSNAELPLIRFKASSGYDSTEIRSTIQLAIKPNQ